MMKYENVVMCGIQITPRVKVRLRAAAFRVVYLKGPNILKPFKMCADIPMRSSAL